MLANFTFIDLKIIGSSPYKTHLGGKFCTKVLTLLDNRRQIKYNLAEVCGITWWPFLSMGQGCTNDVSLNFFPSILKFSKFRKLYVFFPTLLRGVKDVNDKIWQRTFEDVYNSNHLQCPWYPITGNHDWVTKSDGSGGNGTAQLHYSALSERWTFPDFFYTVGRRKLVTPSLIYPKTGQNRLFNKWKYPKPSMFYFWNIRNRCTSVTFDDG